MNIEIPRNLLKFIKNYRILLKFYYSSFMFRFRYLLKNTSNC